MLKMPKMPVLTAISPPLATFLATIRVLGTVWNLVVALCVLHDLMVIPLSAFELNDTPLLQALQWMVLLSWNGDLLISFCTGFYNDGTLVMAPKQIWKHYAQTWLLFDLRSWA